jgi:GAF domain-containing protein
MPERPTENLVAMLTGLLAEAKEAVRADYAALGILDAERLQLEQFLTLGVSDETRKAIGVRPRGRGVLGVLVHEPRPLRLDDVTTHQRAYGFPPGHPEMHGFLGVPILIDGKPWGNLYFTRKQTGSFDQADEALAQSYAVRIAALAEDASGSRS